MSVYKAAILYGLPESTLRDRTLGLQPVTNKYDNLPSLGQPLTFTANEERQLVEHLTYVASIGYGYTQSELLSLATDWAITLHRKKQSDPQFASSWYTGFKRRNPDVTLNSQCSEQSARQSNLTLSAWGEANNVPLDVGCFRPLKNIYHSECQSYMRRNPGMQINHYSIAEISSKAYNKGVCAENLISALRKTGVFQRRRYSITRPAKTAPSAIYTIDHTCIL
ncbi:hypothetical protein MAR_005815 [Mya arenaria]|uniref:HTH CENPB-type domain-containing protein n=1 Tax=Mya arenaria TaxID=6604 RepID=A0ABY7F0K4_MYAAR|nr:hypothetical protein MAR_005815 [Mya arenaria]